MKSNPLQRRWEWLDIGVKMKALAALLMLGGLSNLSVPILPPPVKLSPAMIGLCFLSGSLLIVQAVAIWKRQPFAWQLGFATIALSAGTFVVQVWQEPALNTASDQAIERAIGVIGGLAVSAYWSWLWYRQRDYFTPTEINS